MQVIYDLDRNNDGTLSYSTELRGALGVPLNAAEVRDQLREVRVYILAHEGQMDRNYQYPNATLTYPDPVQVPPDPRTGLGRTYNFAASIGPDYIFYRWKLYTLAIKPLNLR